MTEENKKLIEKLKELAQIDTSLAGILAERKKLSAHLEREEEIVSRLKRDASAKKGLTLEKKKHYEREEKALRNEQLKLVERRKALTTLQNYKLQQAANREIDQAAKEHSVREENLLGMLDSLDSYEKQAQEIVSELGKFEERLKSNKQETTQVFEDYDQRESELHAKRQQLTEELEQQSLSLYERVRKSHPMGPIAEVKNNICSGCFMQIIPQMLIEISRGNTLVLCRGCNRILYKEAGG
jgi:predicted  nucleic acid-binding Zn-ribbon protein